MYRPLDADTRDALFGAARGALGSDPAAAPRAARLPVATRSPRVWPRVAFIAAGSLAAAAAVFGLVHGRIPHAVPSYVESWETEERPLRSGAPDERTPTDPSRIHVQSGDRFELVVRPTARVNGPIVARAFLVHGGTRAAWDADVEIAEGGAVRLRGPTPKLFPAGPGDYTLVIAIGEPTAIPPMDAVIDAPTVPEGAWRRLVARVRVR
jgi:hypothetical protein